MLTDARGWAIATAGLCSFLDLYATQSLLPLFTRTFGATPAAVSLTVSATTLAIALVAPFVGLLADFVGRKRIIVGALVLLIVPTLLIAFATSLEQVVALRFVQGLLLPPVFAVTVVYIGDEWPTAEVPAVTGVYMAGSALGGFLGRFLSGIASDLWGWHSAFLLLAGITAAAAAVVALFLPRERSFVRARGLASALAGIAGLFRLKHLLATFMVGFAVLFAFVAGFTYVNFYLAAPPFNFSPSALGSIFVVYLLGVVVSPLAGHAIARFGRRKVVATAFCLWAIALLVTLAPSLVAVIGGLALLAASGFTAQICATSYLAAAAREARAAAVGLYVTCYYVGGSAGGVVPAAAWHFFGWPGVIAVIIIVLALAGLGVARYWREAI